MEKKSPSCDVDVVSLKDEEYNSIPNGGNMTSTDTCMQLDIDPAIWDQLMKQNNELLSISTQLSEKLQYMVNEDNALQGALSETQQQLGQTIDKVTNDRSQLNNINKSLVTIDAEQEDTNLNKRLQYAHMIVWFILLLTVISLTAHAFVSSQSKAGDILGLIFALIFCLL